jgi:hypothetical protein
VNGLSESNRKVPERSERFFPLDDPPTIYEANITKFSKHFFEHLSQIIITNY